MYFRKAHADDAERIARLHAESWRQTYRGMMRDEFLDGDAVSNRLQFWRDLMAKSDEQKLVLVADEGSTLAGFICATRNEDVLWGSYVDNLHVAAAHRSHGVGMMLMRMAAEWLCSTAPHCSVYLWVMQANARARRFYEGIGASNVGIRFLLDAGGGSAPNCRYVWRKPEELLRAVEAVVALCVRRRNPST
jgi:ribosomal protein S18 acetylase RimI-like enzyme